MTDLSVLVARSVEVIEAGQGPEGGFLAAPSFPTYRFSWFRDGAFIADAMSRHGHVSSAERFFDWCGGIIGARRGAIASLIERAHSDGPDSVPLEEHLHTRYRLDGSEGTDFWENFQLDGYGAWLWALEGHVRRHGTDSSRWTSAIEDTVRYLRAFWSQPSYDWWEEHPEHVHVSTLGSILAGLSAATRLGCEDDGTIDDIEAVIEAQGIRHGHLVKWLGSPAVDASTLSMIAPFGVVPAASPIAAGTIAAVEDQLGRLGVHRFRGDTFYGGGSWILLAGFLGLCHAATGSHARAREILEWMASQADRHGHLPEQVAPLQHPEREAEWVGRWGPSASPLLWSHAMFLSLAMEIGVEVRTS